MRKKVVIIGGGFAGFYLAKSLQKEHEVILIDSKPFFEFTPGILRTIVEPRHREKIQILYKEALKNSSFILDSVEEITARRVKLKDGDEIRYDYLIVCSGSSYREPIKEQNVVLASRANTLAEYHEKLKNANTVSIIGGGTVGVELTGEIVCKYPEKKVTLIHSRERLMDRDSIKTSEYALDFLQKRGVDVIFNERVVSGDGKNIKTDKGREINADIVFSCIGIKPNSEFLKGKMKKCLDEKGFIKVNEFVQVQGFHNIFAPGDVNDLNVEKTAQNAKNQAQIVLKNINSLENSKSMNKYDEKHTPVVISLGKYDGILEFRNFIFTGFFPAFLKWAVEWKEMFSVR